MTVVIAKLELLMVLSSHIMMRRSLIVAKKKVRMQVKKRQISTDLTPSTLEFRFEGNVSVD